MYWDLLRKDLRPTGCVKRSTCVAAIVPACHLPPLNKWCAAGFCRASLRLSRGGLLRPISCRERAVRGRSRAAQFWAAQLNNELKAITRLCEAERSTVGEGGAGVQGGREGGGGVTPRDCDYGDEPCHADILFSLHVVAPHDEWRRVGIEMCVVSRCFFVLSSWRSDRAVYIYKWPAHLYLVCV